MAVEGCVSVICGGFDKGGAGGGVAGRAVAFVAVVLVAAVVGVETPAVVAAAVAAAMVALVADVEAKVEDIQRPKENERNQRKSAEVGMKSTRPYATA